MDSSDNQKVPVCSQGAVHSNVPVTQGQPQFLWEMTSVCERSHCLDRLLFYFPCSCWNDPIRTYCPKRAKTSQHFSQAEQRPACPEWEPDPRCSLMVHQRGSKDVKGIPKDKSMTAGNKEQCFTTCPQRHVQVIGVPHCRWQLFNFYWNSGQTPTSTGCGKNTRHRPEVVKLPLFDTNKNYQFLNIRG